MCVVQYTFDSEINIYIEYNVELHIIVFYCEDMGLVDQSFTFTITVTVIGLENQCGICSACCVSSSATIIIVSPCINPVIDIGIIIDIDFDFNGPTIWNPPPCTVTPPVCAPQIIYVCHYVSGPYTGGIDLCSYVSFTNVSIDINFDINTGVFVFDTDDYGTFLPGVYVFQIDIQIGVTI